MFVKNSGNLRLVKSLLEEEHQVLTGERILEESVDLFIMDYPSFMEQEEQLRALKEKTPVYTPVILLAQNFSSLKMKQSVWDIADDILPMPMPKQLLQTRVNVLLRSRKYSLELQHKNEELELFKKAVDSTNSGIVITDARQEDNPIIFCNSGFEKITGYEEEEILGKNCRFLQNDDRRQDALKVIRSAIDQGKDCRVTIQNYTKSGKPFWNELNIAPIKNRNGQVTHFVGVQNDLTDILKIQEQLRESQQRWEQLVTQNPALILIFANDTLKYINPAGAEFFGFENGKKLVGESISELISTDNHEKIKTRVAAMIKGEQVPPTVYKISADTGETRYLEVQSARIHYKGEDAIQTVGLDVTKRVKYEQKLEQSLEEKRTLLQEIHHRVKNNLAVVSGLLELQSMEIEDNDLNKILMENRARIMSIAKVHEMLYQNEHLSRIEFDGYIRELTTAMMKTYKNRFVKVDFELDLQPVYLNIDQAVPCGLIINELLTNAIKHAFPDQDHGTIYMTLKEKEGKIRFTISDNGIGLKNSFDIKDRKTLGTTIIRLLVNQLHADFSFETDSGTLFEVTFERTHYSGPSKKLSD